MRPFTIFNRIFFYQRLTGHLNTLKNKGPKMYLLKWDHNYDLYGSTFTFLFSSTEALKQTL